MPKGENQISHEVEPESKTEFEKICKALPGTKKEVLEAIVRTFGALPLGIQENLVSRNEETRNTVLEALGRFSPQSSAQIGQDQDDLAAHVADLEHRLGIVEGLGAYQGKMKTKQASRRAK